MRILKAVLFTVVIMGLVVGLCPLGFAGLSITPPVTELMLEPDEVYEGNLTVTNTGDAEIEVKVNISDFSKSKDYDLPLAEMLEVSKEEFPLNAGKSKTIEYKVVLPGVFDGERLAQIFFSSQKGNIKTSIGSAIYIASKVTSKFEAEIKGIAVEFIEQKGERFLAFKIEIKNSGTVHIRPTAKCEIIDYEGKKVAQIEMKQRGVAHPGEVKEFYLFDKKLNLSPGEYVANLKVDIYNSYSVHKEVEKQVKFVVSEDNEILQK